MLELNGLKYSKKSFKDYKFRAIAEFFTKSGGRTLNIYTTDEDRWSVSKVLDSKTKKGVIFYKIIHWTSKKQDDLTDRFIEESLKNFK